METAKKYKEIEKGFYKYFDTVLDVMVEYRDRNKTDLADLAAVYARMVQAARWLETYLTRAADLELQEVKPAITFAVADTALTLAARVTRHYYIEQDLIAAGAAGLNDE